ncbi:glycoside hydrolase family 15 [Paenibacillus oenotherae]|uniref:Glycoside hydrolase family 15 n=1 Tax=Paenibacillus oenotherae TaxID=1435645 RepID=A0ABS7D5R2_9BACL|nr:glycoside hydrolase family 15 [Paenibacillus oenotherae]
MSSTDKPYLIDAITGNSRFLASLGRTGRIYRLWWPNIDFPQHLDRIRSGLYLEGHLSTGATTWFDDGQDGWQHEAAYVPQTNVFRVKAANERIPVSCVTVDFAVPDQDVYVREYSFTNESDVPVSFQFIFYSSFHITDNRLYNTVLFDEEADALVHYRHRYYFSIASSTECSGFHAGRAWDHAGRGTLYGNIIDTTTDGALSWRVDALQPGQTATIPVYIAAGLDRFSSLDALRLATSRRSDEWYAETVSYWKNLIDNAAPCPTEDQDIKDLYERSVLMFKLMSDEATGSIVAAPEFDEGYTRCGGYAYCWGRDAAFITTALDKAGLTELTSRFYDWALTAQDPDGSWQQRHYHDGTAAPTWGIQLDEGASIIWGMLSHYNHTQDRTFLDRVWPAVSKGADYLASQLDAETGLPRPSRDLWEERIAEHTYTAAAVYGGLSAAASFARLQNREDLATAWEAAANSIKNGIDQNCWNEAKNSYHRALNLEVWPHTYEQAIGQGHPVYTVTSKKGYTTHYLKYDSMVDISLLGIAVPFAAVDATDERMRMTADTIEKLLASPEVGGIRRYENDDYMGGNPWILTTLWLAHYRITVGEYDKAREMLRWAVEHRTDMGLLPEQVDRVTGETAWVVPLTWSHAMFILAVSMLAEGNQL